MAIAATPIVLSPWPSRPTFTDATLTAAPQALSAFRTIAASTWYSLRNIGTAAVSLYESSAMPDPANITADPIPAGMVTFIQERTGAPWWVWGDGAEIEIATAPWWRAIVALGYSIPRLEFVGSRLVRAGDGPDLDFQRVDTYGELAAARVEREAPGAPQAVRNEAVIRYVGYLANAQSGAIAKYSLGPVDITYETRHGNAWRNCGAAGLLAPWKARRAGVIG